MLALKGWTVGAGLVALWAVLVLVLLAGEGVLGGFSVITRNLILYTSLFGPCLGGAYLSTRGLTPAQFWEAVADALFWGGIFAFPAFFLAGLLWRQVL